MRGRQLVCALALATQPGANLVVAGDLNAATTAAELAPLRKGLDATLPPTLQGERADRTTSRPAIDHLVLVEAHAWRVRCRPRALDQPDPEGLLPSDHAAVVVDLQRV